MVNEQALTRWMGAVTKDERTRLAPTPSGSLHRGNAMNFLLIQALAKASGATVLLRIDDLDADRTRTEYLKDIFDSLKWLGIAWDTGPMDPDDHRRNWTQQGRLDAYQATIERVRSKGHLYACSCSRSMLREALEKGRRTCGCRVRKLPFDDPDVAWRLAIPEPTEVGIPQLGGGMMKVALHEAMTDPVIRQRDGSPSYHVASLTDDEALGTTFIVRGDDLLPSTACQLYMADLLGFEAFLRVRFLHHALELDEGGMKLSKSAGASSLKAMREADLGPGPIQDRADKLLEEITRKGA